MSTPAIDQIITYLDDEGFSGVAEGTRDYLKMRAEGTEPDSPARWATYVHRDIDAAATIHNDYDDPPEYYDGIRAEVDRMVRLMTEAGI